MKLELISIDEPESLNSDDADQGFKSVLKETMNDVKFVKEMKRMSSIHKDKKRKVKKKNRIIFVFHLSKPHLIYSLMLTER